MQNVARQPALHRAGRRWGLSGWRGSVAFWRLIDGLAIWPSDGLVEVWPGDVLALSRRDYVAAGAYRGLYERAEHRLFGHILAGSDQGVAIDVGANVGIYTSLFSRLVGPSGRVLAFEPDPDNYQALDGLVRGVPLRNVTTFCSAVGARAGTGSLRRIGDRTNTGLASLRPPDETTRDLPETTVPVVRLDEVTVLASIESVELIKVDVEGAEAEVVAGAEALFRAGQVAHAVIEVSPEFGPIDYARDLLELGDGRYRAFRISESGRARRTLRLQPLAPTHFGALSSQANVLFTRSDRLAELEPLISTG